MNQGVYVITHNKSNKKYVGSSVTLKRRLNRHRNELRKGIHRNQQLQRAWTKYGEEAFIFEVLEQVQDGSTLLCREQYWIDTLQKTYKLYNICPKAGSPLGMKLSDEQRAKISKAHKGKKKSAEHCAALKEAWKFRRADTDQVTRWAKNRLGKSNTQEHIEKARDAWLKTVGSKSAEEIEAWAQTRRRRCSVHGVEYKSVKEACEMTGLYKQKLKAQTTFKYL